MKKINNQYPFRRFLKQLLKNADRNNLKGKEKQDYIRLHLLPLGLLFHGYLPSRNISASAWLRMGRCAIKQNKLLPINTVNSLFYPFECYKVEFIENTYE